MLNTATGVPDRTSMTSRYSLSRSACPDPWISAAGMVCLPRVRWGLFEAGSPVLCLPGHDPEGQHHTVLKGNCRTIMAYVR